MIAECGNSVEAFLKASLGKFAYVKDEEIEGTHITPDSAIL